MFENIKQLITKQLIDEISCLDPTGLEIVGHNVVSVVESRRLIHHGINKDNKPSGYTIDSFSDDSTIAAEYSTDKKYFEYSTIEGYKKIEHDVKHALDHKPPNGPDKIYLITNQEEPPSFRSNFNTTTIFQSHGSKIIIYDAHELSKLVLEQSINNPNVAVFYKQAFPGFSQNLDNYEYYGKVPARCDNHISENNIVNIISRHFERSNPICVLHGVSGSGKTQATIDFVHNTISHYENILWISGDDWKKDSSLSSIQRTRGGTPINVVGIFNAQKTLLVIDSLERILDNSSFSDLEAGFRKAGNVLVTSQLSMTGDIRYLPIPAVSENVAIKILGEEPISPSRGCKEIVKFCSFSPLILSTLRNLAELGGIFRDDLYKEVLAVPQDISEDGSSIIGRILKKIDQNVLNGLKKIANSGSTSHDSNFLNKYIGIMIKSSLQRLSIIVPSNAPGILKVHDLIIKAVADEISSTEISMEIEQYIDSQKGEMSPSVLREIHLCYQQLCDEDRRRGKRNPDWISYALIQVEGESKNTICNNIYNIDFTPDLSLPSIMSIIDAKESHGFKIECKKERSSFYNECAEKYKIAFDQSNNEDIRLEFLHHCGKALRRCGEYQHSLDCFDQLLSLRPEWHATLVQIAHLGTQTGVDSTIKERGEKAIRTLVDSIKIDFAKVPLRVSLAMIARLRSYRNLIRNISSDRNLVMKLANIISSSALEGFGQFYEAYVSFTSMFGYDYSDICIDLAEQHPILLAQDPEVVEENQWVSACESLINTANAAKSAGKIELFEKFKDAGVRYAVKISNKPSLSCYNARVVAKAYLLINQPKVALEVMTKVPSKEINHWLLYRKAEALLTLNESPAAITTAKKALELVKQDQKAQGHIPSYYHLLSQCYEKKGDFENASENVELAINSCSNHRYLENLQQYKALLDEGDKIKGSVLPLTHLIINGEKESQEPPAHEF